MKEKPRQVVSWFRLRSALGGRRNYPIKAKKSPSIREVKEVREVRDDRPACFVILLS